MRGLDRYEEKMTDREFTYDGNVAGYTDVLGYATQYVRNLIDDFTAATDPEEKILALDDVVQLVRF